MCCSSQSFPGVKLTKKSLIFCVLLTNLVFLGQSLLAQGTLGGSSSPTAVPANSEGFGATIFWVGAAIFACIAAAGGIILARKLHQQKTLVAAGAVPAPAPRKLFSLPANGNGNGHGNGSRSLKLDHKPAKATKFSNHTNGNNSKRRRMFNYSKFYTEMVLQGPSPTSSAESNYAYNGYNGYYVEYESPRINNNGNGHTNGNGNGHSNGNGANGHDHQAADSAADSNVARAAHADLLAGQKSLIEEQQRLIHEQARLIEEKSRLIAEKNQLLDRQSQMIDNNLL